MFWYWTFNVLCIVLYCSWSRTHEVQTPSLAIVNIERVQLILPWKWKSKMPTISTVKGLMAVMSLSKIMMHSTVLFQYLCQWFHWFHCFVIPSELLSFQWVKSLRFSLLSIQNIAGLHSIMNSCNSIYNITRQFFKVPYTIIFISSWRSSSTWPSTWGVTHSLSSTFLPFSSHFSLSNYIIWAQFWRSSQRSLKVSSFAFPNAFICNLFFHALNSRSSLRETQQI
jgi:hypothetical protein